MQKSTKGALISDGMSDQVSLVQKALSRVRKSSGKGSIASGRGTFGTGRSRSSGAGAGSTGKGASGTSTRTSEEEAEAEAGMTSRTKDAGVATGTLETVIDPGRQGCRRKALSRF